LVIANQKGEKHLHEKYQDFSAWKNINDLVMYLSTVDVKSNVEEQKLVEFTNEFLKIVNDFTPYISPVLDKKRNEPNAEMTQYEKYLLEFASTVVTPYQNLVQQLEIYDKIGFDSAVISSIKIDNFKGKYKYLHEEESVFSDLIDTEMKFECTNESEMVKKYALGFTDYSILMSATIGNPVDYAKRLRLETGTYSCFEVESDFDFSKSPIFKVQPMISMSHKDKIMNTPTMLRRIVEVIDKNPGIRGLIHTGNYENMRALQDLRHPRIMTYGNSAEKEDMLRMLESRPDAVIAGPSLIEGIDLKDDLCRFMMYMKVPYLSLASKLNQKKMTLYSDWYNFQTLVAFQQGLGRPKRSKHDWCKTYLLDKSFESFFSRYKLPHTISDRLVETNISDLDVPLPSADDEWEAMMKKLETK
jgi:hypothetical protein